MSLRTTAAFLYLFFLVQSPGMVGALTQTFTFGPDTPIYTDVLTFQKYGGNAADITSINISYDMDISGGQMIADNDSPTPQSFSIAFGADGSASSNDVTLLDTAFQPIFSNLSVTNSADLNLAPNSGDGALDFDPTPPDGTAVVGQSISGSGSQDVNALFYSQFAGGGTFDLAIDVSQVVDFGQSNGVEFAFAPVQAGGSVTITINLVPEPSVGLLSMIGIWLLAMRRRRP